MSKNVPEVRFDGFIGEWEEKFLGNEVEFYSGLTYSPEDIVTKNGTLVLRSSNVKNGEIIDADNVYVDPSKVNSQKVKQGDVIVVVRNGSRQLIGKHATVKKKLDNTVIGAFMTGIRSENSNFTNAILDTTQFAIEINRNLGATINQITTGNFKKMKFFFPSNKEQQKIGTFFEQLDDTIALQQQLVEQQQQYKKAMLQKMFSQKGESVPKVRFFGFTDKWEQRKLEEVVEDVSGNDGRTDLPVLTISAGQGWMSQKDRFSQVIAGNELKNYTLLKKGELSYNHGNSKLAKYGAVFELNEYDEALVPRVYHSFKSNHKSNPTFLEYLFSSKIPDRELGKLVTSGARMDGLLNINKKAFFGITISIPKLEEQQKIGTFFKQLDDTITLHEKKLEDYQQLKKALLKRMFV